MVSLHEEDDHAIQKVKRKVKGAKGRRQMLEHVTCALGLLLWHKIVVVHHLYF